MTLQTPSDAEKEATANALISAAQRLREIGRPSSEYAMLAEAARLAPTSHVLKAFYWAALRAHDHDAAAGVMSRLTELLGTDARSQEWLEKGQQSLRNRVSLGNRVSHDQIAARLATRRACSFTPVPGRICYVLHNTQPYASGGYATRAQGVALGLKAAGYDPICIARPGFPVDLSKSEHTKIPLGTEIDGIPYRFTLEPSRRETSGKEYIEQSASVLVKIFQEVKPSIVMAASNYLTSLPAQFAARELGIPFIYEVRGFWEVTRISREPEYQFTKQYEELVMFESLSAGDADHVFTLTTPMKEELVARGVDAGKITLLPNSCVPERFTPRPRMAALAQKLDIPAETPVIGYIGTFVQYEGLEHLAEACGILADRGLDFRLLLIGNENVSGTDRGPITEAIMKIAEEKGISSRLIMPGRVPHEEVEAYYSLIDIAPFPRKPQPVTEMVSPMKPLEALAMEKAVIVSSVRAMSEMIQNEETGLVFEKGNVSALADALERLIANPDLRQKFGKAGRAWVQRERSWEPEVRQQIG